MKKLDDDMIDTDTADLAAQVQTLQAQVQAMLATRGNGLDEDRLEAILNKVAQVTADAQERAANPSNKTHPGISVFSRPKGDRADPRDPFKCPMFWNGYDLTTDTTTDTEITLLNSAEPGIYQFRRSDGSVETLTVNADRDPAGKISRLLFTFPTKENRDTLPSMVDLLRQAFHVKSPEQIELETLRRQVAELQQVSA
jgi:hypothetical protein